MATEDKENPTVDEEALKKKAKKDPKSRNYNNANSRNNLRQYQKKEDPLIPELVPDYSEDDGTFQANEIVRGRKLSPELVKKLIPQRGVFTSAEKKRFTGIVIQYLSDFKNEEPTASDVDDIFEIAKSLVLEGRILQATRDDPAALLHASQFLEKVNKRKNTAKENLASRRVDRKDSRLNQTITIIDLVVQYDADKKQLAEERINALMSEVEETAEDLKNILLEGDG